jgi:predicted nucleic acid-binding protein
LIFPRHRAFCDTSFFFASLCPDDINYERAGEVLNNCVTEKITLCTTWDIISETVTLLRYRAEYRLSMEFLDNIVPSLSVVTYDRSVRDAAIEVFRKLSRDKRLSFCDVLSYVVITQLLEDMPSLSFDRDFRSLGLTVYP